MDVHLFKPPGETVKLSKIELFKVNTYNFNIWEHTKKQLHHERGLVRMFKRISNSINFLTEV